MISTRNPSQPRSGIILVSNRSPNQERQTIMIGNNWLIVLRPDGVAVDVRGGAPSEWLGRALDRNTNVPRVVREHARQLVTDLRQRGPDAWLERIVIPSEATGLPTIELLAIEAIPLRRAPASLFEVLSRTTEVLLEQANATHVALKIVADKDLPDTVCVDVEKIAWGVATLVGNALRHVAATTKRNKFVQLEARHDVTAHQVVISVRDNGPGIPQNKLDTLLRRDPATQRAGGLALAVLNDVVVAHGGRMMMESSTEPSDHGTTVHLILPTVSSPKKNLVT